MEGCLWLPGQKDAKRQQPSRAQLLNSLCYPPALCASDADPPPTPPHAGREGNGKGKTNWVETVVLPPSALSVDAQQVSGGPSKGSSSFEWNTMTESGTSFVREQAKRVHCWEPSEVPFARNCCQQRPRKTEPITLSVDAVKVEDPKAGAPAVQGLAALQFRGPNPTLNPQVFVQAAVLPTPQVPLPPDQLLRLQMQQRQMQQSHLQQQQLQQQQLQQQQQAQLLLLQQQAQQQLQQQPQLAAIHQHQQRQLLLQQQQQLILLQMQLKQQQAKAQADAPKAAVPEVAKAEAVSVSEPVVVSAQPYSQPAPQVSGRWRGGVGVWAGAL